MSITIGQTIDSRYILYRYVASGGMADIYEANDRILNKPVALKFLKEKYLEDPNAIEQFKNEMLKNLIVNYTKYIEKCMKDDNIEFTYYPTYKFEGWLQKQENFSNADFLSRYPVEVKKECLDILKDIGCDYLSESSKLLFMVN